MEKILYNLALIDTTQFCITHKIDCSGSHLEKAKRGYTYALIKDETQTPLVSVTFHKSSTPTHLVYTTKTKN